MKKVLFLILLLAVVASASFYWYSTQRISEQLERVAGGLEAVGRLRWDSVTLDPRGRAIINNLAFLPAGERDEIRIRSLTLITNSLPGLLEIAPMISRGQLPSHAGFRLSGLRLPLNPLLADLKLETLGLLPPLRSRGCGLSESLTIANLIEIGYVQLDIDADLNYWTSGNDLHLELKAESLGLSRISHDLNLMHAYPLTTLDSLVELLKSGYLLRLDYQFEDQGITDRLDQYCAGEDSSAALAFRERHFEAWRRAWTDEGLAPTPIVEAAYQHFLEQRSAALGIKIRPEAPIPVNGLNTAEIVDLLPALNLSFSIAQGPDIELSTQRVASTRPAAPVVDEMDDEVEVQVRSADTAATDSTIVLGRSPGWNRIELSAAGDHIGDQARILLEDGVELTGRIMAVDSGNLQLLTRSRQGEFTRPLRLDSIIVIEIRP
ncbi:MAG: hypothetical protein AAGJ52_01440 [Pseudomonadota bacterium]